MTDKELLEAAAKAAGVPGRFIESFPDDGAPTYSCGIGNVGRITPLWNPLTNDGDALRLAVQLYLDVMTCCQQHGEIQVGGAVRSTTFQQVGEDPNAATRRAIVRAAAEIGRLE